MRNIQVKTITALLAATLLIGCAPRGIRVRCDQHLVPINPPSLGVDRPEGSGALSKKTKRALP
jgi:hypothetical protein